MGASFDQRAEPREGPVSARSDAECSARNTIKNIATDIAARRLSFFHPATDPTLPAHERCTGETRENSRIRQRFWLTCAPFGRASRRWNSQRSPPQFICIGMNAVDDQPSVREYPLSPELRRCCWYAVAGGALFVIISAMTQIFIDDGRRLEVICMALAMYFALILVICYFWSWRLRIDERGVSTRRLSGRDLWTWEELGSGRIRKEKLFTLIDPETARELCLDSLGKEARKEVMARINEHYRLPPAPEVPQQINIRYGFRSKAFLDSKGIRIEHRGQSREYPWSAVQNVRLWRWDPLRRDFRSVLIVLPDQEIKTVNNNASNSNSYQFPGTSVEQVNEFMYRHLAAEKIEVTIIGDPLVKPEHIEHEIKERMEAMRILWVAAIVFGALFATLSSFISSRERPKCSSGSPSLRSCTDRSFLEFFPCGVTCARRRN